MKTWTHNWRSWHRWLLPALPLALLVAPLRHVLEGSMALHMLVELPLLLASGWAAGAVLAHHHLPAGCRASSTPTVCSGLPSRVASARCG